MAGVPTYFDDSTAQWALRKLQALQPPINTNGRTLPTLTTRAFWGKVVEAGPDAEADYTDERYWIRRSRIKDTADHISLTDWNTDAGPDAGDPYIITATNVGELTLASDGTYSSGTHVLEAGTPVVVFQDTDGAQPPVVRFWFISAGAGITGGEFQNQGLRQVSDLQFGWGFDVVHALP